MKTLLRTTILTAALALSAFAMTGHAISSSGYCSTFCHDPSTQTTSQVSWYTTETTCCGGRVNPCPPGTNPGGATFQPDNGFARICRAN